MAYFFYSWIFVEISSIQAGDAKEAGRIGFLVKFHSSID